MQVDQYNGHKNRWLGGGNYHDDDDDIVYGVTSDFITTYFVPSFTYTCTSVRVEVRVGIEQGNRAHMG